MCEKDEEGRSGLELESAGPKDGGGYSEQSVHAIEW